MTRPKITQEMINAYDEYTHLTLDRRGFMEKLTRLAGSGAAAAAIAPMLAANQARAAIVPADDPRREGRGRHLSGRRAGEMKGYLASPPTRPGKLPGVIVIHENRGLNPHIEDVARRMALEGFVALGAGLPVAARRHARRRGRGARDDRQARPRRRSSPIGVPRSTS